MGKQTGQEERPQGRSRAPAQTPGIETHRVGAGASNLAEAGERAAWQHFPRVSVGLECCEGAWGFTSGPLWGLVPTHSLAAAAAAAPAGLAWLPLLWLLLELQGKLLRSGRGTPLLSNQSLRTWRVLEGALAPLILRKA